MAQLPDIFYEACHAGTGRYDITTPYRKGNYILATDGRMMVRTPYHASYEIPETNGCTPDCDHVFQVNSHVDTPEAIPCPLPPPVWETIEDEDHDELQLRIEVYRPIKIGDWYFQCRYLRMLRNAGVTSVFLPESDPKQQPHRACYFKGDGFDGILMSCIPQKDGAE